MYNNLPTVAIIGRANVGKSTIFNRLVEKKKALVSEVAGTTRDRNFGICNWRGVNFNLVDTGGITKINLAQKKDIDEVEEKIIEQAKIAAQKADLILFVTDGQNSVLSQDKEAAKLMREAKKPIIFVVNKADNNKLRKNFTPELLNLGFDDPQLISAKNGGGVGDLLDVIVEKINSISVDTELPDEKDLTKVAIIGKPNVGKSSILNAILGEDQVIVSEIPHTTRSPQDILLDYKNETFLLVDTAGIRRKTKIDNTIEKQSVKMSFATLDRADIILFIIEAGEPMTKQDKRLINFAIKEKKSLIFVVNKWDLVAKPKNEEETKDQIWSILPNLSYIPIVFTSATEKYNVGKLLPLVQKVIQQRNQIIPPEELKQVLLENQLKKSRLKKLPKIYSLKQGKYHQSHFILTVNKRELVPPALSFIIKKAIRQKYEFLGTPVSVGVVKKRN